MKTSMPSEKILRERMKYFVLQDFRGILYTTGRLVPGKQLVFKKIYVEIGWIGQKRIKTREQTYMELMVEMMEEFIKELT
jgi:CxxC motif-containing protein